MATSGEIKNSGKGSLNNYTVVLNWSIISSNIATNSSVIKWTLTMYDSSLIGDLVVANTARKLTITIDGVKTETTADLNLFLKTSKELASGESTIEHNADGTKTFDFGYSLEWDFIDDRTPYLEANGVGTLNSIPRAIAIISAPDFNDEESPTIIYESTSTPALYKSLQACISLNGSEDDIAYRNITLNGSSYTFNLTTAERNILRNATISTFTTVKFYIKTTFIDGTTLLAYKRVKFNVINSAPTLSPTVKDINARTVALTGNSSKFIKGYSNAQFTVGATARKGASIEYRTIRNGAQYLDDYTSNTGTMNAIESNTFYFSATDSRKLTTNSFKTVELIPYVRLTCALDTRITTANGDLQFTISGNYYSGSFGAKNNSLEVEYSLRDSSGNYVGNTESGWIRLGTVTPIVNDNRYTYTHTIGGLDYQEQYELTVNVIDELTPIQTVSTTVAAVPIFDWGKNDFHHHTDVYLERGKTLRSKSNNGTDRALISTNEGDTTVSFGWGNYNAADGETRLAGNTVNLMSRGAIKINSQELVDFVVEQGESGGWTYRKWNSGRVELYGTEEIIDEPCNIALGGWYRTAVNTEPMAYPFSVRYPNVNVSYDSAGYGALVWQTTESANFRPPNYYLIRPLSTTIANGYVRWQVNGYWK